MTYGFPMELHDLDFHRARSRWMNCRYSSWMFWHVRVCVTLCADQPVVFAKLINGGVTVPIWQWCLHTEREGDGRPAGRKWERRGGWKWRRGNEMEREEGKSKRGHKSRGLWEKRDRMVEKKQFRRRDGKSRWFMRYIYLVNGVFSQFLPGWKRTPRLSHAFCRHLPLPAAMITCTAVAVLIYTYL